MQSSLYDKNAMIYSGIREIVSRKRNYVRCDYCSEIKNRVRFFKCPGFLFSLFVLLALLTSNILPHQSKNIIKPKSQYYTLNIMSVSEVNWRKGFELYNFLKGKKYPVFRYFDIRENVGLLLKIDVGIFHEKIEAKNYAKHIMKKDNLNSNIETVGIYSTKYKNQFEICTVPNTIFLINKNIIEELFTIDSILYYNAFDSQSTMPSISPNGNEIVFCFQDKISKVNLITKQKIDLVGTDTISQLINSLPRWSPSGKYIAFLDLNEWETLTNLYIMKADGTELCCLVKAEGENRVKSFLWHPIKDLIYYVFGYAYGTIDVGGSLYLVDLMQNKKLLVVNNSESRTEVYSEFFIKNNFLYYKIAHHDIELMKKYFTKHRIKIE